MLSTAFRCTVSVSYTHLDVYKRQILGTIQGFTQGFSIKMSHEFGAGDYKRLRKTVANSLLLALVTSAVLLLFSQFFARPILELLQTPDLIIEDSLSLSLIHI